MNAWLKFLLGIGLLFALMYLLSAVVGLLFWVIVVAAVAAVILACLGYWIRENKRITSDRRADLRAERTARRALKDLERKVNKQ